MLVEAIENVVQWSVIGSLLVAEHKLFAGAPLITRSAACKLVVR
jgi:hypothetical protein